MCGIPPIWREHNLFISELHIIEFSSEMMCCSDPNKRDNLVVIDFATQIFLCSIKTELQL